MVSPPSNKTFIVLINALIEGSILLAEEINLLSVGKNGISLAASPSQSNLAAEIAYVETAEKGI